MPPKNRRRRAAKYKPSIVTFFDILGFGNFVEKTEDPEAVAKVLHSLGEASRPDPEISRMFELKTVNFSDTVVRSTNILSKANKKVRTGILFHEIISIVHIQGELAAEGIFLRGSVTADSLYVGNGLIFGPALNRAYKLESQVAIYPRIIIDPYIFRLHDETVFLKADHHDHEMERSYIRRLLRRDSDGVWFVDYLHAIGDEIDAPENYIAYLGEHREAVLKLAAGLERLDSISVKVNWLANYHNSVVTSLNSHLMEQIGSSPDDLMIDATEIGPLYEM